MVDSIKLGVGALEYEIVDDSNLGYAFNRDPVTGEVKERYYLNTDKFNLDIDNRGLRLHFSIPKVAEGINFYPVGVVTAKEVFESIMKEVKEVGIKLPNEDLKVMRLDMFKNVELEYPYGCYGDVLRLLQLKRTNRKEYEEGYLLHNSQRELCFYNKVKEIEKSYGAGVLKQYGIDGDYMRGEIRLLKHNEVKKYEIVTIKDVFQNWYDLEGIYKQFMFGVFERELEGVDMNEVSMKGLETISQSALNLLRIKGKVAFDVYGYLVFGVFNERMLLNELKKYYSKMQCYRIIKKIRNAVEENKGVISTVNLEKLYSELKEKFLYN
jgi:hypothetical protein